MAAAPYLICLALLEQNGRRALPLTGRSLPPASAEASDPGEAGRTLALELLLRLWQRSDEGAIRRAAGPTSLLLVELPLDVMSEQLPLLKAEWLRGGSTAAFEQRLQALAGRGWCLSFAKYEPLTFTPWP